LSNILYDAHPSMLRMNPFGTILAVVAVLFGAVGGAALKPPISHALVGIAAGALLLLFYWYLATKMDRLVIRRDEIALTHGLLSRQYTEIGMASVRTVKVSQTLLQRIMDAGDIAIYTTGDDPELVVKGLPRPGAIREHIKGQAAAAREDLGRRVQEGGRPS
jgi:uncharacterized membrane protein YdbT with pleckstrin-like domain